MPHAYEGCTTEASNEVPQIRPSLETREDLWGSWAATIFLDVWHSCE